ncbi:helix-turn-helix domain-containing protein [Companilactobacillus nodensis]|uniref:HTH cro/C1-type domain-containing protein n=1 Tax=Companilactobacillus nodensis DSM 19682 = JCM 14932 = NBRC 107160 TaxID=1423775 RepID=A0A0R1KJP3_9LACO|nr:helix-turn-helix transcriptional regulator [Companilactobacillus nodensis]KRK80274.1 hypothetical protein FD03_GL002599 [Companilactobacillus nodensis DSM 19682 = JCM 14932 = NBRC 107160]
MNNNDLGNRITKLRESKNVSQEDLAKYLNIDRTSLSRLENGKRKVSADELRQLSQYFGVTTDYLLGVNGTPQWATKRDTVDFKDFLDQNIIGGMAFDGDNITEEENERVKIALTQIFWKRLEQIKKREGKNKNGK